MFKRLRVIALSGLVATALSAAETNGPAMQSLSAARIDEVKALRFGMMIHWGIATIYEKGDIWYVPKDVWKPGTKDPGLFTATGYDPDQWAAAAKAAGMTYLLFVSKHHDGMCLWDTATTDYKVTNSPLKIDVLTRVREACDRHGLKLALYFSAGDWSVSKGAENARINREQLKELCTKYGPIEFFWLDICGGIGGSPEEIAGWIKEYQPGCLVGFNGGKGGDMRVGESYRFLNKDGGDSKAYDDYPVREFAKQIVGANPGGGNWFYNKKAPMTPEQILKYYEIAEREQVLLSLDVGPGPDGKLRPQDVKALEGVGQLLRLRKTSN